MPSVTSWPDNTFLAVFSGVVTAQDIEKANHQFSGDARMETVRYSIWDFSRVTLLDLSMDDIEYAAAFDKGTTYVRATLRRALIVTNDQVEEVLKEYLVISDELQVNWDTRIISNTETAKHWLYVAEGTS